MKKRKINEEETYNWTKATWLHCKTSPKSIAALSNILLNLEWHLKVDKNDETRWGWLRLQLEIINLRLKEYCDNRISLMDSGTENLNWRYNGWYHLHWVAGTGKLPYMEGTD